MPAQPDRLVPSRFVGCSHGDLSRSRSTTGFVFQRPNGRAFAFGACCITSPGCRTRRAGAPFASLSKRRDGPRVGRKERSDWSRQRGVRCRGTRTACASRTALSRNSKQGLGARGQTGGAGPKLAEASGGRNRVGDTPSNHYLGGRSLGFSFPAGQGSWLAESPVGWYRVGTYPQPLPGG